MRRLLFALALLLPLVAHAENIQYGPPGAGCVFGSSAGQCFPGNGGTIGGQTNIAPGSTASTGPSPVVTFSGASQGSNFFGLNVNENLGGGVAAGAQNANTITINTDAVINPNTQQLDWLQINGNVGNKAWAQNITFVANQFADNGGNTYVNTSGITCTTLNSGTGPSGTGTGIADNTCTWDYVGTAWSGKRAGLFVNLGVRSQSSALTDANLQEQAALFQTTVNAPQGGTATTNGNTRGFFYASADQMYCKSGATFLSGCVSHEFDVGIFSGASAGQRTGIQIIAQADLQGAQHDDGIRIASSASSANPTTQNAPGFLFPFALSVGAIDPTGTVLGYDYPVAGSLAGNTIPEPPPKFTYGIDFNAYLAATCAFRASGGFCVDGSGFANIQDVLISGTSAGATIDIPGSIVTAVALNSGGANYKVGNQLAGPYGTIITVATLSGSSIATFTTNVFGGTTSASPSTTGVAFSGGNGSGATFNLTFSSGKVLALNPSGTAVTAPTPATGNNTTNVATTAFVHGAITSQIYNTHQIGTVFTVPSGSHAIKIERWGAGGSGGPGPSATLATTGSGGGGGGGGAHLDSDWIDIATSGITSCTLTVGTGGASVSAGTSVGNAGTDTTVTCNGSYPAFRKAGGGGAGSVGASATASGGGGSGSVGVTGNNAAAGTGGAAAGFFSLAGGSGIAAANAASTYEATGGGGTGSTGTATGSGVALLAPTGGASGGGCSGAGVATNGGNGNNNELSGSTRGNPGGNGISAVGGGSSGTGGAGGDASLTSVVGGAGGSGGWPGGGGGGGGANCNGSVGGGASGAGADGGVVFTVH